MLPLWRLMMLLLMVSPSPSPAKEGPWARPNRSKISFWCSLGTPSPRSMTATWTLSPFRSAMISIGPPSGE